MRVRLDILLVDRGLAESRVRARALILAGRVQVSGHGLLKAGTLVDAAADVAVSTPEHPWVSRGGMKLAHALDVFQIDVSGALALDIGASTGGFTDVLLARGARRVIALDVGHGQIHWRLRQDPRVTVVEGVNARSLRPADLPEVGEAGGSVRVDIVTVDVSFISLGLIFPVIPLVIAPSGEVVALVKPQFEAGRERVGRGGIVTDPAVHADVVEEVTRAAGGAGLHRVGLVTSPIRGAQGNREFLMHLRRDGRPSNGPG